MSISGLCRLKDRRHLGVTPTGHSWPKNTEKLTEKPVDILVDAAHERQGSYGPLPDRVGGCEKTCADVFGGARKAHWEAVNIGRNWRAFPGAYAPWRFMTRREGAPISDPTTAKRDAVRSRRPERRIALAKK